MECIACREAAAREKAAKEGRDRTLVSPEDLVRPAERPWQYGDAGIFAKVDHLGQPLAEPYDPFIHGLNPPPGHPYYQPPARPR